MYVLPDFPLHIFMFYSNEIRIDILHSENLTVLHESLFLLRDINIIFHSFTIVYFKDVPNLTSSL